MICQVTSLESEQVTKATKFKVQARVAADSPPGNQKKRVVAAVDEADQTTRDDKTISSDTNMFNY